MDSTADFGSSKFGEKKPIRVAGTYVVLRTTSAYWSARGVGSSQGTPHDCITHSRVDRNSCFPRAPAGHGAGDGATISATPASLCSCRCRSRWQPAAVAVVARGAVRLPTDDGHAAPAEHLLDEGVDVRQPRHVVPVRAAGYGLRRRGRHPASAWGPGPRA